MLLKEPKTPRDNHNVFWQSKLVNRRNTLKEDDVEITVDKTLEVYSTFMNGLKEDLLRGIFAYGLKSPRQFSNVL